MPIFSCKTRGNADPTDKPRVYFTAHPSDFPLYFEKLCADILEAHDCAIYYTEDMTAEFSEEEIKTDLGRMNLFAVPVTYRLLTDPCRAMRVDVAYAKAENIPILPLVVEEVPEELYSRPENFEDAQYLSPYSKDATALQYGEKLRKRLDAVFTDDDTVQRVREAFDSYIFLSYRKRDRHFANELMRLLHTHPDCWDVAIWYDEFLVPGESFRRNIDRAMEESKFVTLLVTPTLLERHENGEPNFVMREEYPAARKMGKTVFPVEMQATDPDLLAKEFPDIPDRTDPTDREGFEKAISRVLTGVRDPENDNDPEHKYLIGMAYLYGIDMETDRARGISLIREAAEAGEPEAMTKLFQIYDSGIGVHYDYDEALAWMKRAYAYAQENWEETSPDRMNFLNCLSYAYAKVGDYQSSIETAKEYCRLCAEVYGEDHSKYFEALADLGASYSLNDENDKSIPLLEQACAIGRNRPDLPRDTFFTLLGNLAMDYMGIGKFEEAFALQQEAYDISRKLLGDEHPGTLFQLFNLANTYQMQGHPQKALDLYLVAQTAFEKALGKDHPRTLTCALGIVTSQLVLGLTEETLPIAEKTYTKLTEVLGEMHPDTLAAVGPLVQVKTLKGEFREALALARSGYSHCIEVLGERHSQTATILTILLTTQCTIGEYTDDTLANAEKACALCLEVFGEESPFTLSCLASLAQATCSMGQYARAVEVCETLYPLYCKQFGAEHSTTLALLVLYAKALSGVGNSEKALAVAEKAYHLLCKVHGANHPTTIMVLSNIGAFCAEIGQYDRAIVTLEKGYSLYSETMGEDHPSALSILQALIDVHQSVGNTERALLLYRKAFFSAVTTDTPVAIDILKKFTALCNNFKDLADVFLLFRQVDTPTKRQRDAALNLINTLRVRFAEKQNDNQTRFYFEKLILTVYCMLYGTEYSKTQSEATCLIAFYIKEIRESIQKDLAERVALLEEKGDLDSAEFLQILLWRIASKLYKSESEEVVLALEKLARIRYAAKKYCEALSPLHIVQASFAALYGEEDARVAEVRRLIAELEALVAGD